MLYELRYITRLTHDGYMLIIFTHNSFPRFENFHTISWLFCDIWGSFEKHSSLYNVTQTYGTRGKKKKNIYI